MQDRGYELRRIPLPRTPVNKARRETEATYSRTPAPSGRGCSENSPWLVARLHAWLSQFRDGAYLLQHAQVIGVAPVLHKLAVLIAPYMGLRPRYLSAGRSDAKELASVCTAGCDAAGGHLSLGEDGLDRVVHVRESAAQGRDKHLESLKSAPRPPRGNWGVFDIVGGKQLVCQLKVAAVEHLLRDAPEGRLVLFRRHRVSSFPTRFLRAGRLFPPQS